MKTFRNVPFFLAFLAFLTFLIFSGVSFAQVKPLASGDIVTRQGFVAKQTGNEPIAFSPTASYTYKMLIEGNGDRKFLKKDGSVLLATDKFFTATVWMNKPIDPARRFVRFPQDQGLQAGMKWAVPTWTTNTDCHDMPVNYTATSVNDEVSLSIDGTDRKVKTIRINYEATLPTCRGDRSWRLTHEVQYSPELNELLGSKVIGWDSSNPNLFLSEGSGWAITAIQTAKSQ